MLLRTMESGPRAPRYRALATEVAPLNAGVYSGAALDLVVVVVAPLNAGVYSGAALDLVVAGFSRCEESPNKWQPASAAEL